MKIPEIINKAKLAKELGISKQLLSFRQKRGLTKLQIENIKNVYKKYLSI